MTDLMGAITNTLRPLPYPLQSLMNRGDIPDRILREVVSCTHEEEDDDGNTQRCDFEGVEDVAIFLDTSETLWWCPAGHENGWKP